jgi:hypothetical protein
MNYYSVGDPASKVMAGTERVKQLLKEHVNTSAITPILYFDNHGNDLINYSEVRAPYVFNDQISLSKFFTRQLEEGSTIYTEGDLEKIKTMIENSNSTRQISLYTKVDEKQPV